jgi:hypothetical protein
LILSIPNQFVKDSSLEILVNLCEKKSSTEWSRECSSSSAKDAPIVWNRKPVDRLAIFWRKVLRNYRIGEIKSLNEKVMGKISSTFVKNHVKSALGDLCFMKREFSIIFKTRVKESKISSCQQVKSKI